MKRRSKVTGLGTRSCVCWEKMKEIADHLGIHYSTVSRSVRRLNKLPRDCKYALGDWIQA